MNTSSGTAVNSATRPNSYEQIVKSSSIMGGVAAVSLVFGMIRTKAAAILIGPAGTGLLASFVAIQSVITTLSALGIGSSAVRDVAKAYDKGDADEIGHTVLALRRVCWITGVLGAIATVTLSPWISQLTFGHRDYSWHIALLGVAVFLTNVAAGQTALLLGTRRIGQLARLQLIAAGAGTIVSVPLYYQFGVRGLVPALVLLAAINLALAFFFARQVPAPDVIMGYLEGFRRVKAMVQVGAAIMWNTLVANAATYAIAVAITHSLGIQALGIYSAGFALSAMFVNVVLGAMHSDYYPRLASASGDDQTVNRLVNEQTEVGLLLAVPGLVATITLAPWIIHLLYSREFLPAVTLLHWFTLGCLGRVISWPLAYLLVAKARAGWMMACETTVQLAHIMLVLLAIRLIGLAGAAVAFFAMYLLHAGIIFFAARSVTRFAWSAACSRQIAIAVGFMLVGNLRTAIDSAPLSTLFAALCIAAAGLHSVHGLIARLGPSHPFTRAVLRLPLIGRITSAWPH